VKPLVYIAGPYTHPDPVENTRRAIERGMSIYDAGLAVVEIPHLTMLVHFLEPRPIEFWYAFDIDKLAHCHALYRLPGASSGADKEVAEAHALDMPVFFEEVTNDWKRFYTWCNAFKRGEL
jgi:hypothetical protein